MAQSIMDYIFRRLALDYLTFDERAELGIYTATERARPGRDRLLPAGRGLRTSRSEAEALKSDAAEDLDTDGSYKLHEL